MKLGLIPSCALQCCASLVEDGSSYSLPSHTLSEVKNSRSYVVFREACLRWAHICAHNWIAVNLSKVYSPTRITCTHKVCSTMHLLRKFWYQTLTWRSTLHDSSQNRIEVSYLLPHKLTCTQDFISYVPTIRINQARAPTCTPSPQLTYKPSQKEMINECRLASGSKRHYDERHLESPQ